jgi:hypothetical protein
MQATAALDKESEADIIKALQRYELFLSSSSSTLRPSLIPPLPHLHLFLSSFS